MEFFFSTLYFRMYLVQRYVRRIQAALKIQKNWRGYKCRSWLQKLKTSLMMFQAHCRGFKVRKMITEYKSREEERLMRKPQVNTFFLAT